MVLIADDSYDGDCGNDGGDDGGNDGADDGDGDGSMMLAQLPLLVSSTAKCHLFV